MNAETQDQLNQILSECAELETTLLDMTAKQASLSLGLNPEDSDYDKPEDWRKFHFKGLKAVAFWPPANEKLPPELQFKDTPSPEFLQFMGSLFNNQWLLGWQVFGGAERFAELKPHWFWQADDTWAEAPSAYILWEQAGSEQYWTLGFWYSELEIETSIETIQSLNDFVKAWKDVIKDA